MYVTQINFFVEFISTQVLAEEEILVSFDVVSLFTCVPIGLAVQVAHCRLENDPLLVERTSLSVYDIMDLLTLCLDDTLLSFMRESLQADTRNGDEFSCFSGRC